jgi:hypothetical protein
VLAGLTSGRVVGHRHGGHGVERLLLGLREAAHEAQVVAEGMAVRQLREAARAVGEDVLGVGRQDARRIAAGLGDMSGFE